MLCHGDVNILPYNLCVKSDQLYKEANRNFSTRPEFNKICPQKKFFVWGWGGGVRGGEGPLWQSTVTLVKSLIIDISTAINSATMVWGKNEVVWLINN